MLLLGLVFSGTKTKLSLIVVVNYLHHVIQTVEDVLPGLLGFDAHLHFMLCWGLENEYSHLYPVLQLFYILGAQFNQKTEKFYMWFYSP